MSPENPSMEALTEVLNLMGALPEKDRYTGSPEAYEPHKHCPQCGERCKIKAYECDACGWEFDLG